MLFIFFSKHCLSFWSIIALLFSRTKITLSSFHLQVLFDFLELSYLDFQAFFFLLSLKRWLTEQIYNSDDHSGVSSKKLSTGTNYMSFPSQWPRCFTVHNARSKEWEESPHGKSFIDRELPHLPACLCNSFEKFLWFSHHWLGHSFCFFQISFFFFFGSSDARV